MMTVKSRIKKIETETGLADEKNYLFIHIVQPYDSLNNEKLKGKCFFQKDDFRGPVVIIEKTRGWIGAASDEGKRIMLEHDYQIL